MRWSWRYSRPFSIAVATWPATAVSSARSSLLNGFVGILAAERQDGDRRALEHARHEVVDALIAPELHLLGGEPRGRDRIVERDGVPGVEPGDERREPRQPRHRVGESEVADRPEVAGTLVGEHQRHAIDDERFDDARDQPLAEPHDVEVAVQIAGEADQRAPVVVAIAIEHAVERILHRLFHRLRQQHDDHRRQQRDDPVVRVGVVGEHEPRNRRSARYSTPLAAEKRGIGEAALDDHFDVAQPVPDDRRREGERHEAERHRGELHARGGSAPSAHGKRVAEGERADTEDVPQAIHRSCRRAGQRRDLAKGARQHGHGAERAQEEIHRLGAIEHIERAGKRRTVCSAAGDGDDSPGAQGQRRDIHERQDDVGSQAGAPVRSLGKHQREMQQQRRQQRHRDGITPVEDPVEPIERTVEREA